MLTTMRRPLCWLLLLPLLLAACGPGAAPAVPTEALATAVPSNTPAPTDTKPPTATPTASPVPPTETPTPAPTATRTPRPTATPTPGPGDVVYAPIFETDWTQWDYISFGTEAFTLEPDNEFFTIHIDGVDTYVYSVYTGAFDYADVQLDVDVTVVSGPNRNNLSLVCRQSDLGWYEFNVHSGGLWTIYKYDDVNGYIELSSGGSTAIRSGQNENHLTATCVGDTLTFYINDVKVGSARDAAYLDGSFGMSASTFDIGKLNVRFRDFTVRRADPEAALGQTVAPTVPPDFGADDNRWDAFFVVPLPGGSIANDPLQLDALFTVSTLVMLNLPDTCQDVRVTNTAMQQIVQEFVFNEQDMLVQGEWLEVWTVTACGVASNYQLRFIGSGPGSITFSAQRLP